MTATRRSRSSESARSCPTPPMRGRFWENVSEGRYAITEVDPERWDPDLYYDPDPKAPERTYSKIGGWVRDWEWDPLGWHLPIPPKVERRHGRRPEVGASPARAWRCSTTAGPTGRIDLERTAVVLGNAMSGEQHYLTALRIAWPEFARELDARAELRGATRRRAHRDAPSEMHDNVAGRLPPVTEDTMPGELGNCMAGRVANLFDLRGPNYVVDAACASAMAAIDASIDGTDRARVRRRRHRRHRPQHGRLDLRQVLHDRRALGDRHPTLRRRRRRLRHGRGGGHVRAQAAGRRRARRRPHLRGDPRHRGRRATARARASPRPTRSASGWRWSGPGARRGWSPSACSLVEGHGTSTRVGDVVEVTSLAEAFAGADLPPASVALGSVKSNIGHLKAAAGAAGHPQGDAGPAPQGDAAQSSTSSARTPTWTGRRRPFAVNTELREWEAPDGGTRVAGVSAFGFGGTNFHAVLEEYVPGDVQRRRGGARIAVSRDGSATQRADRLARAEGPAARRARARRLATRPGSTSASAATLADAEAGVAPPPGAPRRPRCALAERLAIDYADADRAGRTRSSMALKALDAGNPAAWKALRGRGIFRGSGAPGKVAFLYTGQGSQYANMLAELRRVEPVVEPRRSTRPTA